MRLKAIVQMKPDVYCHFTFMENYLHSVRENTSRENSHLYLTAGVGFSSK